MTEIKKASPKEVLAQNKGKTTALGIEPMPNRLPLRTVVINPEFTNQLSKEAKEYALQEMNFLEM